MVKNKGGKMDKPKRIIVRCDVCMKQKEKVKIYRAKYGRVKMYSACPECQEEMKITERVLDVSHKKALLSGKYKQRAGSLELIPLVA